MTDKAPPTLFLIAGPNGAGKSTLYEIVMRPKIAAPFINADEIQKNELADARPEAAYEAAKIAADRRNQFIASGKSFIAESVFSHPSKLELIKNARDAGFRIVVYHISVMNSDLSVARVKGRVRHGGHDVPEAKIKARYHRNGALIRDAALKADRAHVYDNSRLGKPPRRILSFTNGVIDHVDKPLPRWVLDVYLEDLRAVAQKR